MSLNQEEVNRVVEEALKLLMRIALAAEIQVLETQLQRLGPALTNNGIAAERRLLAQIEERLLGLNLLP